MAVARKWRHLERKRIFTSCILFLVLPALESARKNQVRDEKSKNERSSQQKREINGIVYHLNNWKRLSKR